jgi:hypothetical protein
MRIVAMLMSGLMLSAIVANQAMADKPSSATTSAQGASASSKSATSTTQSAKSDELTPVEKDLLAQGYKIRVIDGEKRFCRKEAVLGSSIERTVCATHAQLTQARQDARDLTEQIQRNQLNPNGH